MFSFVLFVLLWRERYEPDFFRDLLGSLLVVLSSSAAAASKPGMKKEDGKKTDHDFHLDYETFRTLQLYFVQKTLLMRPIITL